MRFLIVLKLDETHSIPSLAQMFQKHGMEMDVDCGLIPMGEDEFVALVKCSEDPTALLNNEPIFREAFPNGDVEAF